MQVKLHPRGRGTSRRLGFFVTLCSLLLHVSCAPLSTPPCIYDWLWPDSLFPFPCHETFSVDPEHLRSPPRHPFGWLGRVLGGQLQRIREGSNEQPGSADTKIVEAARQKEVDAEKAHLALVSYLNSEAYVQDCDVFAKYKMKGADLVLYRRKTPDSKGLYDWVCNGTLAFPAEAFFALSIDFEHRKTWLPYVPTSELISNLRTEGLIQREVGNMTVVTGQPVAGLSDVSNLREKRVFWWVMKYPMGFKKRDYVMCQHLYSFEDRSGKTVYAVVSSPLEHEDFPEDPKHAIRLTDWVTVLLVFPIDDHTCQMTMLFYEDPKTVIPPAVINFATRHMVPDILRHALRARRHYPGPRVRDVLDGVKRVMKDITGKLKNSAHLRKQVGEVAVGLRGGGLSPKSDSSFRSLPEEPAIDSLQGMRRRSRNKRGFPKIPQAPSLAVPSLWLLLKEKRQSLGCYLKRRDQSLTR
uniref:START domain-containing protein n=1 Tax=Chromera velia CCMP2878 TaxID=1169474 RepID=A0A0G4HIV4_9ALVE|eukprot:Cvel_27943.t1-p1 / transcript=Cvel_27943.t1 / gene=Cvel_27943 / organism=Chromera_velia_CCMP2878 / gene_product=hypothetical protein / transcript_product=hypothetical protein / location=Cvel_scaffold3563:14563-15960(-) / protein_length=466 / sequence_SO=supercontig / SO=protein_coding / is_pseudo=false